MSIIYDVNEIKILNDYDNRDAKHENISDGKPKSCNDCDYADFDNENESPKCIFHKKCGYSEKYFLGEKAQ